MRKKLKWLLPVIILAMLAGAFFVNAGDYYRAEAAAFDALVSDGTVAVSQTDYGWLFDGPSDDTALIFYPGAKVETEAYAPFMRFLAEEGVDVCLVNMPFHLAIFGTNKAGKVIGEHPYSNWFIGGHSLGGAMAADYAAEHADCLAGVVLCAAYPTKPLDSSLVEISLYGSSDGVLNMDSVAEGKQYAPETLFEYVIEGGNHAQFANYGVQKGDGEAVISAEEQQRRAAVFITDHLSDRIVSFERGEAAADGIQPRLAIGAQTQDELAAIQKKLHS